MIKNKKKKYSDEVDLKDYDLENGREMNINELVEEMHQKRALLHMRIEPNLVAWLKSAAEKEGMPYQSFIHHKLVQLMNGKLTETDSALIKRIERIEKKLKIS